MALNSIQCAADIAAAYDALKAGDEGADFPLDFATAYDDYAAAGVVPETINNGGDVSIIEDLLRAGEPTPPDFAEALASYWSGVSIIPVPPNTLVVNDALTRSAAFEAAIMASITIVESNPPYAAFIANLEGVVKSIQWTVTDAGGGTTNYGMT